MSTTEIGEIQKKMQDADKQRELFSLKVRFHELERQLLQLEIDRMNVSKEYEDMKTRISRREA